ncbi:MAG: carboxypeptidase-like regulatory domain-containing protein [Terracidiphilus sp.]|nr:carboxypeptidase-like regulatory domain-containing protein [Terracidiphilus sp.]
MKSHFSKFLLLFLLPFFAIGLTQAQQSASITGVVTDPTGAVIPDVAVVLQSTTTGFTYKATTNSVGSYVITSVTPGPGYKLTFSRTGFQPTAINGVYINVSTTRTQNATLKIGTTAEVVQVSATSEIVTLNTEDATIGNNFQVQFMQELPVANRDSPAALFSMQPGVTGNSATGARTDQSSVTVDGLDVNLQTSGTFGYIVGNAPVDSVQEFRGTVAGMTSSASLGGGGHFDLITKSGSNAFHGALVEYHRDTDTAANSWFNNNSTPATPRAGLHRNQFGGQVGGPIKKNKAFFYFDWDSRRDSIASSQTRTIPNTYVSQGMLPYKNAAGTIEYVTPAQLKSYDPSNLGANSSILSLFSSRYPTPNISGGNNYSTSGYRFNYPYTYVENVYVAKFDYNLTDKQKLWAKFSISRVNTEQSAIQFPGDPETSPYVDRSRTWVIGHTWTPNDHMTNSASWGQVVDDEAFPNTYNPQGASQITFGLTTSGSAMFDSPYASASNAQGRTIPVPVIRDEFNWVKGRHNIQIGGLFKYVNPFYWTILNYNDPSIGMGGYLSSGLTKSMRPSDIASSTVSYDAMFTNLLGHYANQTSTYNYDAKGNVLKQGTGAQHNYRYYEGEVYIQDSWKIFPNLTATVGINWVHYTVPYDKNGIESVPSLDFNTYWNDRLQQSAGGNYGNSAVPFISYSLSGPANGQPKLFNAEKKNFGPHVSFDYSPSWDKKSVFSVGASLDYDRTVVNALLYQQSQFSYIFQAKSSAKYGSAAGVAASLTNDARFAGVSSPIAAPAVPTMTKPFTPYVSGGVPYGLANGQAYNESIDKNFKTPYSINLSFGFQHEFPKGFLLKTNYAGRFGRRLMAQADVNQLIDFPDSKSGQTLSQAVINLENQTRSGATITNQPFFENIGGKGATNYIVNPNGANLSSLLQIGDFGDLVEALNAYGVLPNYVGMGAQFSEFTYYTNKGFSNYNGLLATLHKNAGYGLQFDINYTWSKSIDNVSVVANTVAYGGYGFICDINRPRECRGPSDFDNRQIITGNIIYDLPFGKGQYFGAGANKWEDEIIGGWKLSVLPTWRTGFPYFATANAFVAGYANNAPGILTGSISDLKPSVHKDASGNVWFYKNPTTAVNDYSAPTGFDIGSRNNLYGTHYTNFDAGVGKYFTITNSTRLQFRVDAWNVFNHPTFAAPTTNYRDITQSAGSFGLVNSVITGSTNTGARVLQGALRFEF